MSSRITIKDVSRATGVSVSTVSNALNAPERVAEETRLKVVEAADRLGYRPNRAARTLPKGRSFTIGYCIPAGRDGFFLLHLPPSDHRARLDAGMDIHVFTPHRGQSEADSYREMMRRGAVDGFVLSGTVHDDERIRVLLDSRTSFVTFGRSDLADNHSWVDVDGRAGTRAAVDHLVEGGHTRLALIGWPKGSLSGDDRASGFVEGLEAVGLSFDARHLIRTENQFAAGVGRRRHRLLDAVLPPTAIVTVQDVLAAGVIAELHAR